MSNLCSTTADSFFATNRMTGNAASRREIIGSDDADDLYGGGSNDQLYGALGDDALTGGEGNDMLWGGDGNDVLTGDDGNDALMGGNGDDVLTANYGNDLLRGEAGGDFLYGQDGNDALWGGSGDDALYGGLGDDKLYGEKGGDTLFGEDGADRFIYKKPSDTALNTMDAIFDFDAATGDRIDLAKMDANAAKAGNQAFKLVDGAFSAAGQVYFDSSTQALYGSNDADGAAEFAIQLIGVAGMDASALIL
ncbi:MAG: calcium-binding protein [Methylococcaceae bacterium]|nr:MAG: calcium-binding protein [Methylococcaceae bacterium]